MGQSIYHFIPEEETFERRLLSRLGNCQQSILASAFFTFGAFQSIKPVLQTALANGAEIKLLLGRFAFVTEPRAVDALLLLSQKYPKQLGVYFDSDFAFHFKLAIFKSKYWDVVIIGSSNLTPKGLSTVGEANLEIAGNLSVYRQARNLLLNRIKHSVSAKDTIEDYRRLYKRAKRYRLNRSKWIIRGQKKWLPARRNPPVYTEPTGNQFAFCWINEEEHDKQLVKNIRKEHSKAITRGEALPYQWVHLEKRIAHNIKEGKYIVVRDDLGKSLGFAICTRKFSILDEKNKLESVIFYRYRRGWKAHFSSSTKYGQTCKRLRFADRPIIGATMSRKLKAYLQSRH